METLDSAISPKSLATRSLADSQASLPFACSLRGSFEFLDRILKSRSPHHAYLFWGSQTSAKEEKAREFSMALLCQEQGIRPCNHCRSCLKMESGNHPDFCFIEPEGEKIKISQIRAVKGQTYYPPLEAPWKIFLLSQCESLTEEAAQSMLKLLEEPAPRTIFVLTAPHPSMLLPTLVSRCQGIPFRALMLNQYAAELQKSKEISQDLAELLSGLEVPLGEAKEWEELFRTVSSALFSKVESPLELSDKVALLEDYKDDAEKLLDLLYAFYRDVMVLKSGHEEGIVFKAFKEQLAELAQNLSWWEIYDCSEQISEASYHIRQSGNFRLIMENLLWKLQVPNTIQA